MELFHLYLVSALLACSLLDQAKAQVTGPPVIQNLGTTISVQENTVVGSTVYPVIVTDANIADTHVYSMTSSPIYGTNLFYINSTNGVITTINAIDYESLTNKTFLFNISVSDGQIAVFDSLTINIADENEAPSFQKSAFAIEGDEGTAGGSLTSPGFVVTDPELDTITYTIECGAYTGSFLMDPSSGVVTFSTAYDLDTGTEPTSVTCNVTASDGALSATATLDISINNINDNTPRFNFAAYTFFVLPYTPVSTTIGTINATDGDIGVFGNIDYTLNQTVLLNEYFGVSTNGTVYVKSDISALSSGTAYTISATVTDGGGLTGTTVITIVISAQTTTSTTTTTDRYLTFFEDPRNIAWFTCLMIALAAFALVFAYMFYMYGSLDACVNCCNSFMRNRNKSFQVEDPNPSKAENQKKINYKDPPRKEFYSSHPKDPKTLDALKPNDFITAQL